MGIFDGAEKDRPGLFSRVFGGAADAAGDVIAGDQDPRLTEEQNKRARQQALLAAGLTGLMASESPAGMAAPSLNSILAQGVMQGQQTGRLVRGQMMRTAALDTIPGLDARQKAILQALPENARAQMLAQLGVMQPSEQPDLPADMRGVMALYGVTEDQLAALPPGPARDAILSTLEPEAGTQVNVDTGTIPPGYRAVRDDEGRVVEMVPISGGPAEREIEGGERQRQVQSETTIRAARTVVQDVDRALAILDEHGNLAVGMAGATTRRVPGTPAHRLFNMVESIKGNVGIDSLLRIKQSGAGLGQVPQSQLNMLASLLGMLDTSMTEQDLRFNLKRIGEIYRDTIEMAGGELYRNEQTGQWEVRTEWGPEEEGEDDPFADLGG